MTERIEALRAELAELERLVLLQRNRMTQLIRMHRDGVKHYERLRALLVARGETIPPLTLDELPLPCWNSEQPLFDFAAEVRKLNT